jgi:dienelactone hydrolase
MTMTRKDIEFDCQGDRCAAWLYPAAGAPVRAPTVVMAHGLSGTRRDGLGPFAERFAAAGIAALVFDHRGFGDSGGEPDLFHPARQLQDWRAAIAFARSVEGVDAERVATFGSSMGGGNALAAAAEDPQVAAAVSQVPFLDMVRQAYRPAPSVSARMFLSAARGGHLPAVGRPDESAFINAPGSEAGWRHVVATGRELTLAQPRLLALAARRALPALPPRRRASLPVAGLRRGGRQGRQAGTGDRRGQACSAGRAAHLPRCRSLRHL